MSLTSFGFYMSTILVYGAVDALACLGLSIEFGVAGITNFGFIIFQAAGAYTAAILSMPNAATSNGGFQEFVLGWNLPWPLPWIGATLVGGLIALPFVFLVGKRLRGDFAAVGLLVSAVLLNLLVKNYVPFLNGDAGISLVPAPLQNLFNPQSIGYQLAYGGVAIILTVLVYFLLRRITESPYGRSLRAMRDNDVVADSLGKNLRGQRTSILVLGGMIAGLSGAVLVGFISLWAPGAWGYAETIVLFAAIIIGGAGNHKGAILGAILVPLGFEEITRFLPPFGSPSLVPALEWVAIGLLIILFLWFRPNGIIPEKRRILSTIVHRAPVTPDADDDDAESASNIGSVNDFDFRSVLTTAPVVNDHRVMLSTQGLSKSFSGVTVVSGVSISIQQGRLTGMIGPNGAGKSTVMAMLAGTLSPTSGQIFFEGQDVTHVASYKRAQAGLVRTFQLASEFKKLTVLENLVCAIPHQSGDSFTGSLRGRRYWGSEDTSNIERAEEILEGFGLSQYADAYAGGLSGGQRRLVEIMRALLAEPTVLLLDEPMAGVHRNLARKIGNHLVKLCKAGMTVVMVEHELSIMDEFCDPVIVLAEGKVLAEGTMAELRANSEVVEAYLVG
ncbi:MAG TPA: branched-chain amino acid ABC transporter ATP-binding protein/permease [Acidimicrobiales bacterium]|nr:branched-chain amino acid ABC transporter ATP-binding protein/permease [Acidimicrobiales bacterium]